MQEEKRFAVLIDAENVSSKYIKYIFDEISNYGSVTYKRIYGDWTAATASSWKNVLLENSLSPVQQYSYTQGKNASDSAMIIDAMDILYSGNVEGFCLVSSDSDFTKLAMRLREDGMMVIGMGEKKTPKPFSVACNVFKYLDVLTEEDQPQPDASSAASDNGGMTDLATIQRAIENIINEAGNEGNRVSTGELGSLLQKRYPDFDVRNYGYTKLSKFLKSFQSLEVEDAGQIMYVSLRRGKATLETVRSAILNRVAGADGSRMDLGQLHQWVLGAFPNFNVKYYGYANFLKFVHDIDGLTVKSSGRNGRIKRVVLS